MTDPPDLDLQRMEPAGTGFERDASRHDPGPCVDRREQIDSFQTAP